MKFQILFILLFLFPVTHTYSQEFTYKKIIMDGMSLKTNGDISISDTILKISTNGKVADYPVDVILKKEDFVQYKMRSGTTETQVRFTFQPNTLNNKTEKYTLLLEIKDTFSDKLTSMIYFLIPRT